MNSESGYNYRKEAQIPVITADVIINIEGGIVMVKRKNPPSGWALPGGFVEKGETLEEAARREMKEETGLELTGLRQFHAYSDPRRDPRFHTVTVVFTARGKGDIKSGSDAAEACIFGLDELPEKIAFDHRDIISDFKEARY
ncbi:MAG: NUDIX hydrolase [Elusimicrobiota bacterium]|nr:NUDIX hydrolase [Elusimicrobiota bacterium]